MLKALPLGLAFLGAFAAAQQSALPARAAFHCMGIAAVGGGAGGGTIAPLPYRRVSSRKVGANPSGRWA